tara:strand:- start:2062 stop:3177 length:1116 start_codon:yes stop_codon:yes gene_type:complete
MLSQFVIDEYDDEYKTLDNEWNEFIKTNNVNKINLNNELDLRVNPNNPDKEKVIDVYCSDIKISTKTNIVFLNKNIDIYDIFWKINILDYDIYSEGIIKKQIKISCLNREELNLINNKLLNQNNCTIKILNNIDNPNGRTKFKHIQKITIGISKKDILNSRSIKKSAFYNCIVMSLRILYENVYNEIHIKLFNTGKIEIPGIKSDDMFRYSIDKFIKILQKYYREDIYYNKENIDTILINSHFYCNYNINRDLLFNIIRYNYNINSYYDSCSYPGIQSTFYYNTCITDDTQQLGYVINKNDKYVKISFMIFRTGSVLIVGKCNEEMINCVYKFIKNILFSYSDTIYDSYTYTKKNKTAIKKKNKRLVYVTG